MYASLMLFFLSNTIESQLMSSGAFEVFYNGMSSDNTFIQTHLNLYLIGQDVPVWSKLTTGRIPSPPEMFEIIDNQNKLYARQLDLDFHTLPEKLI